MIARVEAFCFVCVCVCVLPGHVKLARRLSSQLYSPVRAAKLPPGVRLLSLSLLMSLLSCDSLPYE